MASKSKMLLPLSSCPVALYQIHSLIDTFHAPPQVWLRAGFSHQSKVELIPFRDSALDCTPSNSIATQLQHRTAEQLHLGQSITKL